MVWFVVESTNHIFLKKIKKLLTHVENHDIITKLSRERNEIKKQLKKLLTDIKKYDNLS